MLDDVALAKVFRAADPALTLLALTGANPDNRMPTDLFHRGQL